MVEKVVWLCFIFVVICVYFFVEEIENLLEIDELKGNWFNI